MSVQQFCLRWNNHQPNFISVCSSLLHSGTLVDVTLAAEGRQLQAHKIVLSACSSYFQTLFTTNPCQHPIVILKDVQYDDLKTMVDFMYYGEVNVSQEQLPHILKTAEMLKIKGLAEMPTDAATLTKSESKSSDQQDQMQSSGTDSLWGSSDSQFQHQQHHHHHHQQSQTQQLHQLRRTPSPLGTGASPAIRRKRIRKSSNNGPGDRQTEEHNTVDPGANINLSQMNQMPFGSNAPSLGQHPLHTKIIKEPTSVDVEAHQQDSSPDSLDDGHGHPHTLQIKPETDMTVPQTLPLDISGGTTPSEHDGPSASCSQSQSSHSGLQWTVVDSNYSRFSLSSCHSNLIGSGNNINQNNANGSSGLSHQSNNNPNHNGTQNPGEHQQQQHNRQQANTNNSNGSGTPGSASGTNNVGNPQQGHIQMHYQNSPYSPQIISVNNLVGSYSQNLSTPTSPNESAMVQSVYSQGPTPTQSPVHQMNTVSSGLTTGGNGGGGSGSSGHVNITNNGGSTTSISGNSTSVVNSIGYTGPTVVSNNQVQSGNQTTQTPTVKRKRSVNPQGDENFIRALEAVRSGGIGFCKAARLHGVNNRTLWLEYKKRGYPISRPSIKSRIVKQENVSPSPTPTNEETNYEHMNQTAIDMQVPPTSDTPTPLMCTPHTHPMGVMGFLDTRHMEFPASIHTLSRQRYVDSAVNVNPAAMNLQSINFNSI